MTFSRPTSVLDFDIGTRVLNSCWICARLGSAILQLYLLALVWHQSGQATDVALVASAWIVGAGIYSPRAPIVTRFWGWMLIGCGLLALFLPLSPGPRSSLLISVGEEMGLAFVLGVVSSAWFSRRRSWPLPDERVVLTTGAISVIFGLIVVWITSPACWSVGISLILLVPLLVLDMWSPSHSPLPPLGGVFERWYARAIARDTTSISLELHSGSFSQRWGLSSLMAGKRLFLTLVASGSTVFFGGIWSVVPTPFMAELGHSHQLGTIWWLFAGVLCALILGWIALIGPARNVLGRSDRLLPEAWAIIAHRYGLVLVLFMAVCVASLGLPFLQTPWALGMIFGCYTLAAFLWGLLLPRLRPTITSEIQAYRHILFHPTFSRLQPVLQEQETRATQFMRLVETLLTASLVPALGWLIDRVSVDAMLTIVGSVLVGITLIMFVCMRVFLKRGAPLQYTHSMVGTICRQETINGSRISRLLLREGQKRRTRILDME